MLPIQVALVAYAGDDDDDVDRLVDRHEFLRVASALQVQLTRDFYPIWRIAAVVSAFLSLEDVPPTYIPLVLVPSDTLLSRIHAFHITEHHQPIGLIEARPCWSLAASHELLEILCDPQGRRKVLGESIADTYPRKHVVESAQHFPRQGQVEYLLEVCDPCQSSQYVINGFQVADFVTPHYYAPGASEGLRYSFLGAVKEPRQLLRNSYITWYTHFDGAHVWQAVKGDTDDDVTIGPLGVSGNFSRDSIDYLTDVFGPAAATPGDSEEATDSEDLARESARHYGRRLAEDVKAVLEEAYQANTAELAVSLDELLNVIGELIADPSHRFYTDSAVRQEMLQRLLGRDVGDIYQGGDPPDRQQFETVREPLQRLKQRVSEGGPAGLPTNVGITAMLGKLQRPSMLGFKWP